MFKTHSLETVNQLVKCLSNPRFEVSGTIKDIRQLINTEFWPAAVPEGLIVKNDEQAKLRARSILYSYDIVDISSEISKKSVMNAPMIRFLDYGCGDGNTVVAAKELGVDAHGYDIKKRWNDDIPVLTTDLDKIKSQGPYSHILVYDVIDHVSKEQAIDLLRNVRDLSDTTTQISLRAHPWLSRHGAHTYYKLNKAYAHLFLDDNELAEVTDEKVQKILRPLKYYNELLAEADLNVVKSDPIKRPIEPFFKDPQILEQLLKVTNNPGAKWIEEVLSLEFVDYRLSRLT